MLSTTLFAASWNGPAVPQLQVRLTGPQRLRQAPGVGTATHAASPRRLCLQARCPAVSMAATGVKKPMNALPFLTAASCQSSGLADAETGFDPLYFSDFLDIKFLREAELKHGRICML